MKYLILYKHETWDQSLILCECESITTAIEVVRILLSTIDPKIVEIAVRPAKLYD